MNINAKIGTVFIMFLFFLFSIVSVSADTISVSITDRISPSVSLYAINITGNTTLTSPALIGNNTIQVSSVIGAHIGDAINIYTDEIVFQSIVVGISGNNITIASDIDTFFPLGSLIDFGEWDLSQADGSVTPVSYSIKAPPNSSLDIYTIIASIEDSTVMYESTFGGLPQLTRGFTARITDGYSKKLFLISNNAGFREYGFDKEYLDKVPSGTYGFGASKNFNEVNGVVLRINYNTDDILEFIVSDDLRGLDKMAMTVHGHIVDFKHQDGTINVNISSESLNSTQLVEIVEDKSMTQIAVIITIIAIIAFILYSVKDMLTKPDGALNQRIFKWFQIRDFFVMGHLLASWLIVALAGYIYNISIGDINEPILYAIYIISLWVTIAFNLIYLYVYSLFKITNSFERAKMKIKFNGGRK